MTTTLVNYANKVVLAPMVRVGTLPFRLTVLDYGADLVWSEELVDKRVIGSVRSINPATQAIEYHKGTSLTFSTHADEAGKVILQLGTADPDLALEAALTVKQDVVGIDVNCGCPKKFSVQGGMGAALLTNPEKLKAILTHLVQNLDIPVTCKIRILETREQTLELVKMIESTGVKALTVHCRTRDQRPTTQADWDYMKDIVDTVKSIPVILNGDVQSHADIPRAKELTNASSFMIARGAQFNPSVFRKEGPLPYEEAVRAYLKKSVDVDNMFQNTKYVLLSMNTDSQHTKSERYRKMQQSKSLLALCEIFGLEDYYHTVKSEQTERRNAAEKNKERDQEKPSKRFLETESEPSAKKPKIAQDIAVECL
ncbi:hypothetical protein BDF14DRAFT_1830449 [Spinellus fusiger]|nr:hypothetical protein BDF14DRAFT_1830449 [Spinellus fusiger]